MPNGLCVVAWFGHFTSKFCIVHTYCLLEGEYCIFLKMERLFTYYYRASKLTLQDLIKMKTKMDSMFEDFPSADIA